jgi:hypothetical protein
MAQINMDLTNIDPAPRFDPIPAGDYPVIITASDMKLTKDGSGQYLEMTLEVQGGEFSGRKLFDRLNLHNSNRQAVEIAQRQLSQICHAVGVLQVADSEQLHFKPLVAMVKLRPAREQFDASNEIKGYKAASGAPVQTQFQRPTAPAANPAPARAAAPWEKKAA